MSSYVFDYLFGEPERKADLSFPKGSFDVGGATTSQPQVSSAIKRLVMESARKRQVSDALVGELAAQTAPAGTAQQVARVAQANREASNAILSVAASRQAEEAAIANQGEKLGQAAIPAAGALISQYIANRPEDTDAGPDGLFPTKPAQEEMDMLTDPQGAIQRAAAIYDAQQAQPDGYFPMAQDIGGLGGTVMSTSGSGIPPGEMSVMPYREPWRSQYSREGMREGMLNIPQPSPTRSAVDVARGQPAVRGAEQLPNQVAMSEYLKDVMKTVPDLEEPAKVESKETEGAKMLRNMGAALNHPAARALIKKRFPNLILPPIRDMPKGSRRNLPTFAPSQIEIMAGKTARGDGPRDVKIVMNDAGQAFKAMVDAARAEGVTIYPTSGYRTLAEQMRQSPSVAAKDPTASRHVWAKAFDIKMNDPKFGSKGREWLAKNAPSFGFRQTIPSEPWHWAYIKSGRS